MGSNHRRKVKTINNIIVYYIPLENSFDCVSPDGMFMARFKEQNEAEQYCRESKKFCCKR